MGQAYSEQPLRFARPAREGLRPRRTLLALPDGYETPLYVYEPASGAGRRGAVVYLHGIQSHPGWFGASAAALAGRGYAVYQPTRRGSGENLAARGHADSPGQLLGDVAAAFRLACAEAGGGPVHLLGVSWGGKLGAAYAAGAGQRGQPVPASLTLVAPGIVPQVDVPAATKLAVGAALLCGGRKRFDIPLDDPALFTDNEAMRRYVRDDPHRLRRATARFLYVSRRLDGMLRALPRGAVGVATTLLLAERDRIIDNARTRGVVERLTGGAADVRPLPGAHTLEFEPDPGEFFQALAEAIPPDGPADGTAAGG